MALELREACERCGAATPATDAGAWICSYECTFCARCAGLLGARCPNCGGELVRRPARGALAFHLSEPYAPRARAWKGVREERGFKIKTYAIAYEHPPTLEGFEDGIALACERLPSPAVTTQRPGVGFLIAHDGRGAKYVVLGWWDRENELPLAVVLRAEGEHAWRPAHGGESMCVWDLEVVAFERDAYVATVLASLGVDAYLARKLV